MNMEERPVDIMTLTDELTKMGENRQNRWSAVSHGTG